MAIRDKVRVRKLLVKHHPDLKDANYFKCIEDLMILINIITTESKIDDLKMNHMYQDSGAFEKRPSVITWRENIRVWKEMIGEKTNENRRYNL